MKYLNELKRFALVIVRAVGAGLPVAAALILPLIATEEDQVDFVITYSFLMTGSFVFSFGLINYILFERLSPLLRRSVCVAFSSIVVLLSICGLFLHMLMEDHVWLLVAIASLVLSATHIQGSFFRRKGMFLRGTMPRELGLKPISIMGGMVFYYIFDFNYTSSFLLIAISVGLLDIIYFIIGSIQRVDVRIYLGAIQRVRINNRIVHYYIDAIFGQGFPYAFPIVMSWLGGQTIVADIFVGQRLAGFLQLSAQSIYISYYKLLNKYKEIGTVIIGIFIGVAVRCTIISVTFILAVFIFSFIIERYALFDTNIVVLFLVPMALAMILGPMAELLQFRGFVGFVVLTNLINIKTLVIAAMIVYLDLSVYLAALTIGSSPLMVKIFQILIFYFARQKNSTFR